MELRVISGREDAERPGPGVVDRVRGIVQALNLDCECRGKLDGALRRLERFEAHREMRRLMSDARQQRDKINGLLHFARELDQIKADEPDMTVYEELALLFDNMAQSAARARDDLRAACELRHAGHGSQ